MKMTWWKLPLYGIVLLLAFALICNEQHPPGDNHPPAGRTDTLVIRDSVWIVQVDTVRIEADVPCRRFSINRASWRCE